MYRNFLQNKKDTYCKTECEASYMQYKEASGKFPQ